MPEHVIYAFLGCQLFFVVFVALHDWIPRSVAWSARRVLRAALVTLPFGIGIGASAYYAKAERLPIWVMWWLWVCYGSAAYGMLRAWWVPYLASEPMIDERGGTVFLKPHACSWLGRGFLVNSVYVSLQAAASMTLVLLGVLTFSARGMFTR